jgi:nitrogen fixation NifU-like protein
MNLEASRTILVEHSRSSKNGKFPELVTHEGKITNPVCGDHVELKFTLQNEKISDSGFKAKACAICSASASLLSEMVKGKSLQEAFVMGSLLEKAVMENESHPWPAQLKNLDCFEHLRVNPARKMCALLPWVVLKNAFKQEHI